MSEFVGRIRAMALALGGPGLFLVAFLDSSFLPLPGITDVLLVITVTRNPSAMLFYVAMTVAGSVVGCLALHYLGRKGREALVRRKFTGEKIERAMATLQRNGVVAVLVPCLLPPASSASAPRGSPSPSRSAAACGIWHSVSSRSHTASGR